MIVKEPLLLSDIRETPSGLVVLETIHVSWEEFHLLGKDMRVYELLQTFPSLAILRCECCRQYLAILLVGRLPMALLTGFRAVFDDIAAAAPFKRGTHL